MKIEDNDDILMQRERKHAVAVFLPPVKRANQRTLQCTTTSPSRRPKHGLDLDHQAIDAHTSTTSTTADGTPPTGIWELDYEYPNRARCDNISAVGRNHLLFARLSPQRTFLQSTTTPPRPSVYRYQLQHRLPTQKTYWQHKKSIQIEFLSNTLSLHTPPHIHHARSSSNNGLARYQRALPPFSRT